MMTHYASIYIISLPVGNKKCLCTAQYLSFNFFLKFVQIIFSVQVSAHESECRCLTLKSLIFNVNLFNHYKDTLQQRSAGKTT